MYVLTRVPVYTRTTIFTNLHPGALIHMEIYTYIYYLHIFIIYASEKCNKYSKAIHEKRIKFQPSRFFTSEVNVVEWNFLLLYDVIRKRNDYLLWL